MSNLSLLGTMPEILQIEQEILKQPQVEKILVIKQPEYDILKSQLDSIQKHENGQDSTLLGVDNSEVVYNLETIG